MPSELTVRFEGGLSSQNYAQVLAALGEAQLLRLKPYVDREGLTPAQILAKLGHLPVGTVAQPLDRYLCRINAHICDLNAKTGQTVWKNTKAPDTAEMPRECPGNKLPSYVLCLPDTETSAYRSVMEIKYHAGEDEPLSRIVTSRTEGCTRFDEKCRTLIEQFNPGVKPFSDTFAGELVVPVQAYRLTLAIGSADHLTRVTSTLDKTVAALTKAGQQTPAKPRVYYTVPSAPKKDGGDPTPLPPGASVPDSRELLGKMNYPYLTDGQWGQVKRQPVVVGVWDNAVDEHHCDYVDAQGRNSALIEVNNIPYDPERDLKPPDKTEACDGNREPLSDRWDHATFITGLIGARVNGRGIAGVHPNVQIWSFEATAERLKDDPIPGFVEKHGSPTTINLSLEDPQVHRLQTDLDALIKKYKRSILFVAAAGNAVDGAGNPVRDPPPINQGDSCLIFPACLSQAINTAVGVISVVALTEKADARLVGAHSTNYGTSFDVAAIGTATSTLFGDWFGAMDGTSVAAPFVTGLAALLKATSLEITLTPEQMKGRILYTADFTPALDKIVRFGVINYRRALELKSDFIELRTGAAGAGFDPRRPVRRKANTTLTLTEGVEGEDAIAAPLPLILNTVRRISYDADGKKYWVVYADKNGVLHKIHDARFLDDARLDYADAGDPQWIPMSTIKEYTCALDCRNN